MKLPPGLKYFVLAGVVGLVAVLLVQRYISSKVSLAPKPKRQIVVADLDITPGMALEDRLLRDASWPSDIIPPKSVSNRQKLKGRVVLTPIGKGEPILETKLAPEGTAAGLSGLLDKNMLAVTVKTDEVSGVAGFINPGDRVDLLVDISTEGDKGREHYSKIVLQNLKVLSKGQVMDQTAERKPKVVPTVTLEVSPDQAEMLNLATFQGKIRLALRNQTNQGLFATRGVNTAQLLAKPPAPAPKVVPSSESEKRQSLRCQLIKGMAVSYTEF